MDITHQSWISKKHQKCRGSTPGGCRKILNKQGGGILYQTMRDSRLFIPRTFRTICKQPCPMRITTYMLLWILIAQDTPHYLSNVKQMAKKQTFIKKRTWTQPTAKSMQILHLRRPSYQYQKKQPFSACSYPLEPHRHQQNIRLSEK